MNEYSFEEIANTTSDPDTDINPIELTDGNQDLVYGIYTKLRNYQYHYNLIKVKYKVLSFTWLGATGVGFAYLFLGKETSLPFGINYLIVSALLAVFCSVGLLLLCFLDVAVYHRMIEVIFGGCIKLEKKYPFLLNTHQTMHKLLNRGRFSNPVFYDGLFYLGFVTILLIGADTCITLHYLSINWSFFSLALMWSGGILGIILINLMLIIAINKSSFSEISKDKKNR